MSRHQNGGQNHHLLTDNEFFENVVKFKYLGTIVANQNYIHKEIKSILNSGNVLYHSAQNLLSCRLLSKDLKIKINKTIILPVVLYGCDTWSLTLIEEHRLRVFEKRVRRRIFGTKEEEVAGAWRTLHNEELHDLYTSPNQGGCEGRFM